MRARLAGTTVVLALLAPAAHAQPRESLELADRLYERAAVAAQVRPIAGQFVQGLEDYRGSVPDDAIAALAEAGKKSFAEEALRGGIVSAIARDMDAEDLRKTLDWIDGLAGRRVTLAEAGAAGDTSREKMQAWLESEKGKPASAARGALIADLIRETLAVETGAGFIEAVSLGIAVGMDATRPVEKRIGLAGLRSRLRAAMPPERLRAELGAALPAMYRYVYRQVSDADLADYARFLGTPAGRRYSEAVSRALLGALAGASVRVGEMLPATPERKRI